MATWKTVLVTTGSKYRRPRRSFQLGSKTKIEAELRSRGVQVVHSRRADVAVVPDGVRPHELGRQVQVDQVWTESQMWAWLEDHTPVKRPESVEDRTLDVRLGKVRPVPTSTMPGRVVPNFAYVDEVLHSSPEENPPDDVVIAPPIRRQLASQFLATPTAEDLEQRFRQLSQLKLPAFLDSLKTSVKSYRLLEEQTQALRVVYQLILPLVNAWSSVRHNLHQVLEELPPAILVTGEDIPLKTWKRVSWVRPDMWVTDTWNHLVRLFREHPHVVFDLTQLEPAIYLNMSTDAQRNLSTRFFQLETNTTLLYQAVRQAIREHQVQVHQWVRTMRRDFAQLGCQLTKPTCQLYHKPLLFYLEDVVYAFCRSDVPLTAAVDKSARLRLFRSLSQLYALRHGGTEIRQSSETTYCQAITDMFEDLMAEAPRELYWAQLQEYGISEITLKEVLMDRSEVKRQAAWQRIREQLETQGAPETVKTLLAILSLPHVVRRKKD